MGERDDNVRALLERIIAAPDDEGARLVYADAIGGDHGEALALETELARAGIRTLDDLVWSPLEGAELELRAMQLRRLLKLDRELVELALERARIALGLGGPDTFLEDLRIEHGFVVRAVVHDETIDMLARLLDVAPLTSLHVSFTDPASVAVLGTLPLRGMRDLHLDVPRGAPKLAALLSAMPSLRSMHVARLAPDDVAAFADHPALTELELERPGDAVIARLVDAPIASRLARLKIVEPGFGRDHVAFVDPLRVLEGGFPHASIAIDGIDFRDARAFARTFRMPPSLQLNGDVAISHLAPHLGPVRQFALRGTRLDHASIVSLVDGAPQLERLHVNVPEVTAATLSPLRTLPLQRLTIVDCKADPVALADFIAERRLEAIWIRAFRRLGAAFLATLAGDPRATSLRSIGIGHVELDDAGARSIGGSKFLQNVRSFSCQDGSPISGVGVAALLQLPALVELGLVGCVARPIEAIAHHPTLVRWQLEPLATTRIRDALHERFGSFDHRPYIYLFPAKPYSIDSVVTFMARFGSIASEPEQFGFGLEGRSIYIDEISAVHDRETAAALAPPDIAERVRSARTMLSVALGDDIAFGTEVARALHRHFGGVSWDAYEDVLYVEP